MPNTLLLRLPAAAPADAAPPDAEWLTLDESGGAAPLRQRGPLPLAAAAARGARVVVLAPAPQMLLTEAELPPGSAAKLARVVPFALEEQLTEDLDGLSFAIGRRRPSGGTPVVVVSRALLQGWIAALEAAGLQADALYPDSALTPENPGQTVLWIEGERLTVRRPGMLPFTVELCSVAEALQVAGVIGDPLTAGEEPRVPESAMLFVTREDWTRIQDEFDPLVEQFASIKVQLLPEGPLPWLARSLTDGEAVNLLQGEFVRAADHGASWRRWRTALVLAGSLLAVHVAAEAVQIRAAKRESARLDGEIAQVFAQAMPTETPRDPRRQMQMRLERIRRSASGPQYFLRALQAVGGAAAATPHLRVDALSYREQSLDLRLTAPNLAALAQLSQRVGAQGLTAEIQSSTPVADGVQAHLQIRSGTAKVKR